MPISQLPKTESLFQLFLKTAFCFECYFKRCKTNKSDNKNGVDYPFISSSLLFSVAVSYSADFIGSLYIYYMSGKNSNRWVKMFISILIHLLCF